MAGSNNQFNSQPFLSPNQQDLLMAALNSNNPNGQNGFPSTRDFNKNGNNLANGQFGFDGLDPSFFTSPQNGMEQDFGFSNLEESPYVDFLDGDNSFDFDAANNGDLMIGDLPGSNGSQDGSAGEAENGDKRKSPDDDDDDGEGEGGGKRREGDDKQAKKPGRKPLTSEPTTKRKAQNRAAQRAFRERKEKHLKDLETKVSELEKASDAANHENGLLRAQVQRLQTELKEYRKRLSLNSTGMNRPSSNSFSSYMSGINGGSNNFQFEFPRFGGLPGTAMFNNGPLVSSKSASTPAVNQTSKSAQNGAAAVLGRTNSAGRSLSPKTSYGSSENNNASPPVSRHQSATSLSSPPLFAGINASSPGNNGQTNANTPAARSNTEGSTTGSLNRVFQFNSGSVSSTTDSPSASSVSQYGGANSSCGTSPEPSHNSPTTKADGTFDTIKDGYVCHGNSEGEVTFCEKLNMACGNPRNPIPRAMSRSDGNPANPHLAHKSNDTSSNTPDATSIDIFANQNGGQFDPTLFGDYRNPQTAIVGDGDFTGGFFDEAFNIGAYGSPFNFGETPAAIGTADKSNPLEVVEKSQDGVEEEVVPGDDMTQMLNCHKIWDKLASRPDFKDGTIDIDNLCAELRAKARCSESGVVVDNRDVEAALKRLPEGSRT